MTYQNQWANNAAVLRRFSALCPGEPLPADFKSWAMANMPLASRIRQQDGLLYSLLDGTAPANVVADCLQGLISPIPPSAEEVAKEKKSARLQELFNAKPFQTGNITQQMEMASLDPKLAERCKAEAATAAPQQSDAQIQRAAELERVRLASANRITGKVA